MKLKRILSALTAVALAAVPLVGCGDDGKNLVGDMNSAYNVPQDNCRTYYEIFVRSFADGNGDGIGDLRGLIDNLDYLNDGDDTTDTDLGINGIWLMPIQESPSYHGYDSTDYMSIESDYGTMSDFEELIDECNKRDIWVQIDLVLNHSSNEHPWFKEALREARSGLSPDDEESVYMKMYEFYDNDSKPSAGKYQQVTGSNLSYLCNFSPSQPDLNLDNQTVRDHIEDVVEFWFNKGVHSFRLDAAPYAYGYNASDSGTKNIEFWTWFNDICHQKGADVFGGGDGDTNVYGYNVAEVWSGAPVVNKYFETGMSSFNFPLGAEPFLGFSGAVNGMLDRGAAGVVNTLYQTQKTVLAAKPYSLMSNFLSNHDNNRSAGYFSYDTVKIKKAAGLYLLAPGNPYIYYGEEIGAAGSGEDPDKRLPFNWGDDLHDPVDNPDGASSDVDQPLGSLADQINDKNSIFSYYKEAIKLRNRFPEIGRGVMTPYAVNKSGKLQLDSKVREDNSISETGNLSRVNEKNLTVAAYALKWNDSEVVIVQNIGDKSVSLDASVFKGYKIVGELKADGGSVKFMDSDYKLSLSAGTVAVLKK